MHERPAPRDPFAKALSNLKGSATPMSILKRAALAIVFLSSTVAPIAATTAHVVSAATPTTITVMDQDWSWSPRPLIPFTTAVPAGAASIHVFATQLGGLSDGNGELYWGLGNAAGGTVSQGFYGHSLSPGFADATANVSQYTGIYVSPASGDWGGSRYHFVVTIEVPAPTCGVKATGINTCLFKKGDILLETFMPAAPGVTIAPNPTEDGWGGSVMREVSGEYWFHVGMYDGAGGIIDMRADGIASTPLEQADFLNDPQNDVVVLRVKDQTTVDGAITYLQSQPKVPYYNPVQAMADGVLHGPASVLATTSKSYCSLVIYQAFKSQGLDLSYWTPLQHALSQRLPLWAMLPAGPDNLFASAYPGFNSVMAPVGAATDIAQDPHGGTYRVISTLHSPAAESFSTGRSMVWTGATSEPQTLTAFEYAGAHTLHMVGTGNGKYTLSVESFGPHGMVAVAVNGTIKIGQPIDYTLDPAALVNAKGQSTLTRVYTASGAPNP